MTTDSTIVIGFNINKDVAFFKTFDFEKEGDKAMQVYRFCRNNFFEAVIMEREHFKSLFYK